MAELIMPTVTPLYYVKFLPLWGGMYLWPVSSVG